MAMFNRSKLIFLKSLLVFIVLLTSSISIAQTKEKIDIDSKAEELSITTNELLGIFNSALRDGGSDNPQADSLANIILMGQAANDDFGFSVSQAGDVNGDGYGDVIVGARWNDAGGTNAGRSYIYFGGTSIDNIADVTMTGESAGDHFGVSVSTAGDVNGDGYSDVIVGAMKNDAGGDNAGRSYIYFGGTSMDNIADVTMTGEAADDNFGFPVSSTGDVNGDGYSDVITGAQNNDAGGTNAGRSYIYFGGISMDNSADVIMTGEATDDYFGYSASTAGDVNGDGYSDVIVGSRNDTGGVDAGRAYLYFGGASMDNTADVIMTGEAAGDNFGYPVSTAGDVNGDGYSDVIVGAPNNDAGGDYAGRSYIYYGGTSMDNIVDITMTGETADNFFGRSVSTTGDVNGDGYSDVIVGAPYNDAGGTYAGRSYIYFGGTSMDNVADVIMTGEEDNDKFGWSVSTAGDLNGDGYSDVIVGATENVDGGTGRAYIYISIPSILMWSNQIVVQDLGGIESSEVLTFGQHPDATDSIDTALDEYELPPPPPSFIFDARFNFPTNPEVSSLIDLRESSKTEITWDISFQPGSAGYPMTFSWDSTSFPEGSFYLKDLINGDYVLVNMKNHSSFVLTNDAITILNIIFNQDGTIPTSPSSPTNLITVANTFTIELSWADNSDNEAGFVIERKDGDSLSVNSYIIIDTVATNQIVYTDIGLTPNTTYTYRVLAFNEFGSSGYTNLAQATTSELPVTFQLTVSVLDDWNMVSIPGLHPVNQNVDTWWSGKDPAANVFKYSGGYIAVTTATPTEGYWMKNVGAQVYNYPAIEIVSHDSISTAAGWSLIGGYEDTVATVNLTTNPPGLIEGSVYEYSGGYQVATNLVPGYGYWIKLSGAGQIIIPEVLAKGTEPVEYFKNDWGKIVLTDATGINYTLYAVTGEVNLDKYQLPPMPPAGMFDIRFNSGRIAEDLNSVMQTIEMSGVTYPLTVRVEGMDIRLMDETGSTINVNLKSGEDVVISDATVQKLMVTGELIPAVYALEQNYPNPFNPSTMIEFSLPEDVNNVKLSIYNVLGEKVAELVNTSLVAGRHSYQWNAKNVATGIYIYELRTDYFVSVKKMVLMK